MNTCMAGSLNGSGLQGAKQRFPSHSRQRPFGRAWLILGMLCVIGGRAPADPSGAPKGADAKAIETVLNWNTFLGGHGVDMGAGMAVATNGDIYVAGTSWESWGSPLRAHAGTRDGFVAKVDAQGNLVWNTFLGAYLLDECLDLAIDAHGDVYVIGWSMDTWGTPLRAHPGAYFNTAFVAKLDHDGALIWNTFLGEVDSDLPEAAITLDAGGNVYVISSGRVHWGSPRRAFQGGTDAFVARLDPDGTLLWNTFLGAATWDSGCGIALDGHTNVWVTGSSDAPWGNPVRPHHHYYDAFVAKLDSEGFLLMNSFVGGAGFDVGQGIAVDGQNRLYIAGLSYASWESPLRAHQGGWDGFVAAFDNGGNLIWNTFLGQQDYDECRAVTIDAVGNLLVAGVSRGTWGNPSRPFSGEWVMDGFAAGLDADGALLWNTFLGGDGEDWAEDIVADDAGHIFVTGRSETAWGSPVRDFTPGISDPSFPFPIVFFDLYVAKLTPLSLSISPAGRAHSNLAATSQTFGVSADVPWTATAGAGWITVTGGGSGDGNGTVTYRVAASLGYTPRSGTIVVSGGGVTRHFEITQAAMPTLSLSGAVDASALAWTTGGSAAWFGQNVETFHGASAARSGAIAHGRDSWMQTTVTGPGSLGFWWKVSSESSRDVLRLYVGGSQQAAISGQVNWQHRSMDVPAGTHQIKWAYTKDGSGSAGEDAGWVDKVVWLPNGGPWAGAWDFGNGWKYSTWFGYFYTGHHPWVYHEHHHWLYAWGSSPGGIIFWDHAARAYWWTSSVEYPRVYRYSDGAYLWYQQGSVNPRWFYNTTSGAWESW